MIAQRTSLLRAGWHYRARCTCQFPSSRWGDSEHPTPSQPLMIEYHPGFWAGICDVCGVVYFVFKERT